MVIIFLLLFLIFPRPILASLDIKITDYSSGSETEWIQITNNTENEIILENWVIRDENDNSNNKDSIVLGGCISPHLSKVITHNKGWLNDSSDTIYLYNDAKELIDKYIYNSEKKSDPPSSSNTCIFVPTPTVTATPTSTPTTVPTSTKTPSPTLTSTPTSTVSPTPTSTPTLVNPDTGISMTEFMPYSSIEWIEIYNDNDKAVELKNWKIKDNSSNTKTIPDTKISSKSYAIFEFINFLNNDTDKIILINHNNQTVSQYEYPNNKKTIDFSWSLISNSWCQANITQNKTNESSCYSPTPTPTLIETISPTIIPTPMINQTNNTLYKPDESATASAIFTPTEESGYYITPTTSLIPISNNLVLGETITAKKNNNLPLVFIISGGLLLVSPVILTKLKKK